LKKKFNNRLKLTIFLVVVTLGYLIFEYSKINSDEVSGSKEITFELDGQKKEVVMRCILGEDTEQVALTKFEPFKKIKLPLEFLNTKKIEPGDVIEIHTQRYLQYFKPNLAKRYKKNKNVAIAELYKTNDVNSMIITADQIQEQGGHFDLSYKSLILIHPKGFEKLVGKWKSIAPINKEPKENIALRCMPGDDIEGLSLAKYFAIKTILMPFKILKEIGIQRGDILLRHTKKYLDVYEPDFVYDDKKEAVVEIFKPTHVTITAEQIEEEFKGHLDLSFHSLLFIHTKGFSKYLDKE